MHTDRHELATRLARIEGQVAALKRAVESGADLDCAKTLIQAKAASQGLKRFAEAFSREYARNCLSDTRRRARLTRELDGIISSAFSLS